MEITNRLFTYLKEGILYSLFFLLFFSLQTKTLNTGDAGELVAASYGLGVAHPSGYPVYLMISKFFTFLPFGSITTKVALVSTISSTLLLVLGMNFLKQEGLNLTVRFFFCLLLMSCYSFFAQSLLAKFYPLNTLMIFAIFYLGYKSLHQHNVKYQHTIAFLFGISAGLHQTIYFMFLALLVPVIFHFKDFIKNLLFSFFLFLLGFSNVLYLMVRSWKDTLLNMSPSGNVEMLFYTLSRKAYDKSSSIDIAKSFFNFELQKIFYAIKNCITLLSREFHPYIFIFLISGFIYLAMKNRRSFWYFLSIYLAYSFFLVYHTFSLEKPDLDSWYISAHQYFLPIFLFTAIICSYGFELITSKLSKNLSVLKYLILCFPLIYLPQNFFVNNYDRNHVPYYKTIDHFFVKPIKSVVIYSGDNDVFQGWYLKNVEKFRDDLCLISAPVIKDKIWETNNGCNYKIYKDAYPEINYEDTSFNLNSLKGYMKKKRVYSSIPIEENDLLKEHLKSEYVLLDFMIFPKDINVDNDTKNWIAKQRYDYKDYIHYNICINHGTDDLFTKSLCKKYSTYLTYLAYDIGEKYQKNSISKVDLFFEGNLNKTLQINTNNENLVYLYRAYQINKLNDEKEFYLYSGF